MIWLIGGFLIPIIIGFVSAADEYKYEGVWGFIWRPVVGAIIGVPVALTAAILIGGFFGLCLYKFQVPEASQRIELAALKDNTTTGGSFFLGIGSFESEPSYYYLEKLEGGGYKQHKILADKAIIFETDGAPYIQKYIMRMNPSWLESFALPLAGSDTKIYIPKGSIDTNYKVDLQ